MSSQSAGNEPPTSLASSPHNPTQSTQVSMFQNVESAKAAVLSTLKDTVWPRRSTNTAQDLIGIVENASSLKNIPKENLRISAEHRVPLERFIAVMVNAQQKLQDASNTYGAKEQRFRSKIKQLFTHLDRDKCTQVLEACRNEVEDALASLPDLWDVEVTQEDLPERPDKSQPRTNAPHTGGVQSTGSVGVQDDEEIDSRSVPQLGAAQSTAVVPSSDQDEEQIVPPNQVNGSSKRREWLGGMKTTFNAVEGVAGMIPVVGTYVGAAAKVGAIIVDIIQKMEGNEEAAEGLTSHARELSNTLKCFEDTSIERRRADLTMHISNLHRELQNVQQRVAELNSASVLNKAFSSNDRAEVLKGYQESIQKALEQIQLLAALNTTTLITELYDKEVREEQQRLLDRLGDASYGARDRGDATEDVICLPGTRVEILDRINAWIRNASSSEKVLWIRGMAGRGKSTIASTVVHHWKYQAASAIFHFRRGQNETDKRLVCALARQLGCSTLVPEVKEAVLQSIREKPDIGQGLLREQFQTLFMRSLSSLQNTSVPVLLVIDALDECQDVDYAVNFVKLIDQYLPSLPVNVKFLLTTRPEAPLIRALEPRQWHAEDLDRTTGVDNDIAAFLRHGLSRIRKEYDLEEDWPTRDNMAAIIRMSQGLFQWARTAIEHMKEGSPQDRLQELLDLPSTCHGMDELYLQILSKAFRKAKTNPARGEIFLHLLGTLVVAPSPVSLEIFAYLFADHPAIRDKPPERVVRYLRLEVLADLGSLIHVPHDFDDPIQLMHTSVRDLLVDRERCGGGQYFMDIASNHHFLASRCLHLMGVNLTTNICNLSDLSKANSDVAIQELVRLSVPKGLQYCCRSWPIHLTEGTPGREFDDLGALHVGLKHLTEEKLLGWVEVMSLIGETEVSARIARQIHLWLQDRLNVPEPSLVALWDDIRRFIAVFHEPISFGALHIYASALPFCPWKTTLWKCYSSLATTCVLNGLQRTIWPPSVWSRQAGASVQAIAFSPNGKLLASESEDSTIQLWDTETGAPVGEPLRGHDDWVLGICFSPNGKLLASGSDDKTIRLWDAETGAPIGEPLRGHEKGVWSVCFSPSGKLLASGSDDNTIRLWDAATGEPVGEPLSGHDKGVSSVCFSPNGNLLASGSYDKTIQLWDAETGAPVGEPLIGHDDWVLSICFSPNGKLLASGSLDKTIRLWDAETGAPIGEPLEGHDNWVSSICFSPNGKLLASGSHDKTIRLWDPETGAPVGEPLGGHKDSVLSICFSPDGKLLASGASDNTIQLWDAGTGVPVGEPLKGHDDWVSSICFSPNGKLLASGSHDDTIRLWDAETGAPVGGPLRGHDHSIWGICFSPNGKRLASGSQDKTIRLWDPETGEPVGEPLIDHDDTVYSICFSPNGKLLASGLADNTIRFWDAESGEPVGEPLIGHDNTVYSICFSPSGKLLASGSGDQTIRLWDAETGTPIGEPLRGHDGSVYSICFSPNGELLASGSSDNTIRLWDAETGTPIGEPLGGHDSGVLSICFSPNGKLLASGSHDETIRAWDVDTGEPLGDPLRGHDNSVFSICFSPNGEILASGSSDKTIRFWDGETGVPVGEPLRGHNDLVLSICFSPSGELLASGSDDNTIQLWDAETGAPIGEPLRGHDGPVCTVCFSPNGELLASGSDDNTIQLWDTQTGASVGDTLRGHYNRVSSICFSPNGNLLASGSYDKTIQLWDVETGAPVGEPPIVHDDWILSICFSPNGKLLASGSDDNTVQLWDAETGTPIGEPLRGHDNGVLSICISPDGKLLASGSNDNTVRLWDVETGEPVGEPLEGHNTPVSSVSFSKDGMFLFSSSTHQMFQWDIATGVAIKGSLQPHNDTTTPTPFPSDSSTVFTNNQSQKYPSLSSSSTPLGFEGQWVMFLSQHLLWFPPQYWQSTPKILMSHGTLVFAFDRWVLFSDVSPALML